MKLESHVLVKLAALVLLVAALIVLDLTVTGGDALAGVGQYGRHGG